jgi:hypothetical protein
MHVKTHYKILLKVCVQTPVVYVVKNSRVFGRIQRVVRPCIDVKAKSKQYEQSSGTRRISNRPMHQEIPFFVDMPVCLLLSTRTNLSLTSYNFPTYLSWSLLFVP